MRTVISLAAVAAMLATAGCGESRPTKLEKAAADCLQSGSEWVEVRDEGKTLEMQQRGLDRHALDKEEVDCVLKGLGAPESVLTKKAHTKLHGEEQTASWDDYEAKWSFTFLEGGAVLVTAK